MSKNAKCAPGAKPAQRDYDGISFTDIARIQIGPFIFRTGRDGKISLRLTETANPKSFFGGGELFSLVPGEYLFGGPDGPQSTIVLEDEGLGIIADNLWVSIVTTPGNVRLK